MNIFGQGWNTLGSWDNQRNSSAEALRALNGISQTTAEQAEGSSTLSSLRPGQVFQGQVLNITTQDVTILLDNLQTVHAKLGESVELNIGQKMSFQVKENQGEQILIRPLESQGISGGNPAVEKALDANGFAMTERNVSIANALMESGMPLDKDTMRGIMQQSVRFPEADIKQLVAMNRLQIPVNESNIQQFAKYTAHEHQLTQNINQVIDSLEQTVSSAFQSGDVSQIQEWNHQMIDIFGWKEEVPHDHILSGNPMEYSAMMQEEGTGSIIPQSQGVNVPTAFQSDPALFTSLQSQMSELGMEPETFDQLAESSKDFGNLLSNISDYLEQENQLPAEVVKGFFQSENYRKLLKKGIQEKWLLKPEEMKQPKEIDQLYERIYEQSAKLSESLNQSGNSGQEFAKQSQNMRENIQFIQQLNEQFIFAQLPMKMNGQEANSELFVYANKKKVQKGPEGVKVLLHLDMPNLGNTDVLVRLVEKKLYARFTLEDQTSVDVIAENMSDLSKKLEEKGFLFTNEVVKTEPKLSDTVSLAEESGKSDAVIEEMLNQDLITGQKRFTFDMRT